MQETTQERLTLFYTGNLRGDLHLLPRLHSFLQQLKQQHDPGALLLDVGAACAAGIWHCHVTQGRSALVVLDGMGYHAANVSGFLAPPQRETLQASTSMGLVDAGHTWRYHVPPLRDESIMVAAQEVPALRLCIVAAPAPQTRLTGRTLYLEAVAAGQVGMVRLHLPQMRLEAVQHFALPAALKPDATIAAAVEFVEDEARALQKRQP